MNQAKVVVIWFRMLNLEIELINGLKITSGFGDCSNEDWRYCHEDAAKSSHIGNQFRSGSCFTRQNTLEVDLKQNKCDMLFNLTSEFLLNSFKKWHETGQNWRDYHEDAAKSSYIGNQFGSGSCFT